MYFIRLMCLLYLNITADITYTRRNRLNIDLIEWAIDRETCNEGKEIYFTCTSVYVIVLSLFHQSLYFDIRDVSSA